MQNSVISAPSKNSFKNKSKTNLTKAFIKLIPTTNWLEGVYFASHLVINKWCFIYAENVRQKLGNAMFLIVIMTKPDLDFS